MPISASELVVGYGRVGLLRADFDVPERAKISIVGESGSGKTTLLKTIAGILPPVSGHLSLTAEKGSHVGFIFQDHRLFPWLTVRGNIDFALAKKNPERTDDIVRALGLSDAADKFPHEISGGMRQRVALGRAIADKPRILCLDEPYSALDPLLRQEAIQAVHDAVESVDATVFLVTHDLDEAIRYSDRIWVVQSCKDGQNGLMDVESHAHLTRDDLLKFYRSVRLGAP
jgi:ABC-type nitrate/sulfonate/bicarbonate transport system ATPase subunit